MKNRVIKWEKLFPYIIVLLFLILSVILISRHELWFDEVRAWVIGASSNSINDFINYMRDSEGHPYTWSAILFLIFKYITQKVEAIKIIHLAISTSSVFLFLKYSTFNKIIKTLFVFGYLIFYEYSIISRNYALGILFIFIFCILYKEKYKNIIAIAITLFFMGQTNIFAFLISCVFFALIIIDSIIDRKAIPVKFYGTKLTCFIVIFISSILLLSWQLGSQASQGSAWGPSISSLFSKSYPELIESIYGSAKGAFSAILPLNEIQIDFWGNNLLINNILKNNDKLILILSVILILIPILFLKKRKIIFYILGIFLILSLPIFIPMGKLRHYGHVFILMISMLWISNYDDNDKFLFKRKNTLKISNIFLTIILSVSVASSAFSFYYDLKYPFTVQKNIASYLKENFDVKKTLISGYKDVDSTSVAAYLNQKIFYPQTGEYSLISSYSKRDTDLSADQVFMRTLSFGFDNKQILLILNNKLIEDKNLPSKYFFKKLDIDFGKSIVGYEDAGLYLFERDKVDLNLITSNKNYLYAELFDCRLSQDLKTITFESDKDGLKLFQYPVKIEEGANYLIEFDIVAKDNIKDTMQVDFYGQGYDNPEQEFSIKPDEIKIGEKIKISKVINASDIPDDNNIFFRIFTYSPLKADITNLNIYKITLKN